ncbi:GNAT family N-acetyltransferase [Kineosporia sp. J2-2]|uniref:GNAT family N-acetyltransferase n=1 Tax=Kineosporia corallincola TaxID=2835133 RepID=A0ABS5TBZ5_9ACTN|nr:GNAT family N-acetyltransferase [Kineosporia corallincola]MBT0768605.1 GNAT family N-acetyltransferase [Kineosporia corallincola]
MITDDFTDVRAKFFPGGMTGLGLRVQSCEDAEEYARAIAASVETIFPHEPGLPVPIARQPAVARLKSIYRRMHQERFLLLDEHDCVQGFLSGQQEDPITFNIGRVGMMPDYRKRGAASFYRLFIEYLRELGYERITSHHHPHNTEPIIIQLKLGFFIEGMQLDESLGPRVKLVLQLHEDRRQQAIERFRLS